MSINLTNVKKAIFERDTKSLDTHYNVTPLKNGNFNLYCTHGDWDVQVDKTGKSCWMLSF